MLGNAQRKWKTVFSICFIVMVGFASESFRSFDYDRFWHMIFPGCMRDGVLICWYTLAYAHIGDLHDGTLKQIILLRRLCKSSVCEHQNCLRIWRFSFIFPLNVSAHIERNLRYSFSNFYILLECSCDL